MTRAVVGPDSKFYAHVTTTCLVFDSRPPRWPDARAMAARLIDLEGSTDE